MATSSTALPPSVEARRPAVMRPKSRSKAGRNPETTRPSSARAAVVSDPAPSWAGWAPPRRRNGPRPSARQHRAPGREFVALLAGHADAFGEALAALANGQAGRELGRRRDGRDEILGAELLDDLEVALGALGLLRLDQRLAQVLRQADGRIGEALGAARDGDVGDRVDHDRPPGGGDVSKMQASVVVKNGALHAGAEHRLARRLEVRGSPHRAITTRSTTLGSRPVTRASRRWRRDKPCAIRSSRRRSSRKGRAGGVDEDGLAAGGEVGGFFDMGALLDLARGSSLTFVNATLIWKSIVRAGSAHEDLASRNLLTTVAVKLVVRNPRCPPRCVMLD